MKHDFLLYWGKHREGKEGRAGVASFTLKRIPSLSHCFSGSKEEKKRGKASLSPNLKKRRIRASITSEKEESRGGRRGGGRFGFLHSLAERGSGGSICQS